MTHVGDVVRAKREALGLSQEAVAVTIPGLGREYLSQIESGRTKWPELYAPELARALGIQLRELVDARKRDITNESLRDEPAMVLATAKQPQERTRVLFDQTVKEGWRVKEISIELDGHPNPTARTPELFDELRAVAEHAAKRANSQHTTNPFN
jgi:transcriptional regulator with XRE-family HTH domain